MNPLNLFPRGEFVKGVNRGAQVTGVACASLFLPWVAVMLRFFVRIKVQRFFGREDFLTIASMAIFTVLCSLTLRCLKYGLGAHMHNIDSDYLQILSKYIFVCELLYVATTAITKVSIGCYFLRLSSKRYQVFIIYTTMAVVVAFSTAYFFFLLLQCHPIQFFWVQFYNVNDTGSCLSKESLANVTYAHAAMSAVTDWAFGLLPISFVWGLKMNRRTKFSVLLILSLGFFASTATIVRIFYIQALSNTTDYTWEGINLVKWSLIEPAIALTAASFATLRPLFTAILSRRRRAFSEISGNSAITLGNKANAHRYFRPFDKDEYTAQFAEMLGLHGMGVTTFIYADRPVHIRVDIGDIKKDPESSIWQKNPEYEDSMEISALSDGTRNQILSWNEGVKTVVTTQTID